MILIGICFILAIFLNPFDLDFVINGKVISLSKVIKHLKNNQSSLSDYSANETIVHCQILKNQFLLASY